MDFPLTTKDYRLRTLSFPSYLCILNFSYLLVKKLVLVLFVIIAFTSIAEAQVRILGSNSLRLGSGETDDGLSTTAKRYLEEIANARIFYEGITVGIRYELSDPSEVGQNFTGFRRRWIQYQKDGLEVQAGSTFALYGRGLMINMFESRPLNYDTWIDGFSGSYELKATKDEIDFQPSLKVSAIGGNLTFIPVIDTNAADQNIKSQAINSNIGFFNKKLNIGVGFVQAFVNIDGTSFGNTVTTSREVNQPEVNLSFITENFEGFIGFTEMRSILTQYRSNPLVYTTKGQGVYGSLSYTSEDFGITGEYKDYRYFVHEVGADYESYLSKLPISSPPEVYKEFTYTTITRTTHSVNFDDELGFQLEANVTAIPDMNITLYGAGSSRHLSFSTDTSTIHENASGIPNLSDDSYFPFWEYFAEVEHTFGDLDYIKGFFHRRSDVIAYNGEEADSKRSSTFGLKFQYQTTKSQSLLTSIEVQDMYDAQRHENDHKLMNLLFIAQYSFNPLITFGGQYDFTTWYENGRHIWPQVFTSVRIGSSHTLLVSYGAERGGLNCTGGVCRVVPAFEGFRVGLTSQL
jgi:hypothetical protein